MSLPSILDALRSIPLLHRTPAGGRRVWFRPQLEPLDGRCLPSFSPIAQYTVGTSPQAVATGDFNNDTVLDLAVVNSGSSTVSVLLGNGDGTFQPAVNSDTGSNPLSAAVGDFDKDGKMDLATANSGDVSVMRGNGDGSFGAPVSIALSDGSSPQSVAVGDFNADGKMDLGVTSNAYNPGYYGPGFWGGYYGNYYYPGNWYPGYYTGSAHVLIGDGLGDFSDASSGWLGYGYHTSAAVADFNGDGNQDFATANLDSGTVDWLAGNGVGNLGGPAVLDAGGGAGSVAAGDVNGDGKADLVTANRWSNNVGVLLGNGLGGFAPVQTYATGSYAAAVVIADFNHDSNPDIATADGSAGVSVLLGRGNGTFTPPVISAVGSFPWGLAAGDFNGGDWADIATANSNGNNVSVLINDNSWPAPDAPSVSINDVSVTEGNTGSVNATFTLTLSAAYSQPVTVHYTTADGTATAGSDYTAASGDVTIPAGNTTQTFTVAVLGDRLPEPTETFSVNLSGATNGFVGDGQGVGAILDNEPRVSVNDMTVTEGNTGSVSATFTVSLSAAYDQAVTVLFATANGTATAGSDYQSTSGTLTIPAGKTTGTITVLVNGDRLAEPNETVLVNLSGATNATIADGQGVGTIVDNEPRISINDVTKFEGKKGQTTPFVFTVTLSAAYDQAVTVSFRTVNGTATTSNHDYAAKSGTLTFAPGVTTKTITIEVKGDNNRGADEYFYVDLFNNSTNSLFARSRGIGKILNDD